MPFLFHSKASYQFLVLGIQEVRTVFLIDNFPDVVALALGIDIDMALQQDPIDWTSKMEIAVLV